jgi:hypothetical protein
LLPLFSSRVATGAAYERDIAAAKRQSEEKWKQIKAKLDSLQDEKKGTEGLAQMMEMVINIE